MEGGPPGHPHVAVGEVVGPVDDGVDAGVEHGGQVEPVQHQVGDLGWQPSLGSACSSVGWLYVSWT